MHQGRAMCRLRPLLIGLFMVFSLNLQAQQDFREETIYFLMTTRFFDGDANNTRPTEWSSYGANSPSITDPNDVTWRGDFKGLMSKLDYIKDLGFTAIWITPVVQNRGPLDYHGYHAWDFTKVDPRLESVGATFQDLINAVHAKGMKIILDIVTNHTGRHGIKGLAEIKYNTDPTKPWAAVLNPNWSYDGLTPNPVDNKIWSRANLAPMPAPYNSNLANFNFPSTESYVRTTDPNWFHQSGNGFAQGYDDTTNLYQRALAGDTPDLNTEGSVVENYMFNAYKTFIDMGVDGFRWDTWKHMAKADVFRLLDRFRTVKPDLFVVGEVAQKRHELHQVQETNPHWYTWRGNVNSSASANVSVLDFYAEATFHGVFQEGGNFSGVQAAARYDNLYSDPSQLVTWLDNHDFGPNNDWNQRYGGSDENLAACMNFMFTWRGIPCVYYGTENRFKAGAYTDIHDASGIAKSIDLTGRAYFGGQFANAPNHRIYKHIKKLNAIRRAIPALQKGSWTWAGNAPNNGVGYWREYQMSKVAVGLAKDGAASFTFNNVPNGVYRDAVTGRAVTVANGNLSFTVQSNSAGIYVLNGTGMIGESGGGFFETAASTTVKDITIYFKKPPTWGTTVKIHYWNVSPNANYPETSWPGVAMTLENGWYKFTFNQIISTNFVINGNSTPQTADLSRSETGWYDYSVSPAVWYNTDPRVIPIELVDFKGNYNKNKRQVELNWRTASEFNNAGFTIERSFDGFSFNKIGTIKGFGTTRTPQYYSFFDIYFSENKVNYYRLKQIDNDGKEAVFKTVSVAIDGEKTLKIYPNIVNNGILHVVNSENEFYTEGSYFSIFNLMGQAIKRGKAVNSIDVSDLPQGIFILKMGERQAKFVKQ